MVKPRNLNNYQDWRILAQSQSHEKDILKRIVQEKRKAHAEYRTMYKKYCYDLSLKYRELEDKENKQRNKLIDLIPDKI